MKALKDSPNLSQYFKPKNDNERHNFPPPKKRFFFPNFTVMFAFRDNIIATQGLQKFVASCSFKKRAI